MKLEVNEHGTIVLKEVEMPETELTEEGIAFLGELSDKLNNTLEGELE